MAAVVQQQQQAGDDVHAVSARFADSPELLQNVLCTLTPKCVARCQAVCRKWKEVAGDPRVRRAVFVKHWRLQGCVGCPRQVSFFETATLSSFVHRHEVGPTDSLQRLAVRYGSTLPAIKRVNNLMTDHSLHSRAYVYVPVSCEEDIAGALVSVQHCGTAKRDVAVMVPGTCGSSGSGAPQPGGGHGSSTLGMQIEALRAKLSALLGRSLHIEAEVAKFYLEECNGDLKAAIAAFEQDLQWESKTGGVQRLAPLGRYIRGEAGL